MKVRGAGAYRVRLVGHRSRGYCRAPTPPTAPVAQPPAAPRSERPGVDSRKCCARRPIRAGSMLRPTHAPLDAIRRLASSVGSGIADCRVPDVPTCALRGSAPDVGHSRWRHRSREAIVDRVTGTNWRCKGEGDQGHDAPDRILRCPRPTLASRPQPAKRSTLGRATPLASADHRVPMEGTRDFINRVTRRATAT